LLLMGQLSHTLSMEGYSTPSQGSVAPSTAYPPMMRSDAGLSPSSPSLRVMVSQCKYILAAHHHTSQIFR